MFAKIIGDSIEMLNSLSTVSLDYCALRLTFIVVGVSLTRPLYCSLSRGSLLSHGAVSKDICVRMTLYIDIHIYVDIRARADVSSIAIKNNKFQEMEYKLIHIISKFIAKGRKYRKFKRFFF